LQRQILHNVDRIGMRKVDSAKMTLTAMNPDVKVITYDTRLGCGQHLGHHRRLRRHRRRHRQLPDALPGERRGAAQEDPRGARFDLSLRGPGHRLQPLRGTVLSLHDPRTATAELAPSCAEAGVLGVLPGIVGSIQAIETIKLLLELGDPLVGRLLTYDSIDESFRTFKVRRDPTCQACGEDAGPIVIAEYDDLCMPHPT
jgi:molybdopterin/thiamine biosynthesis adenylyltransferase